MKPKHLERPKKLRLEEKIYLTQINVDEGHPHLKIRERLVCKKQCAQRPCLHVCPVKNYALEGDEIVLSWEGCFECGTCRICCPQGNVEWRYPRGGFGVCYKYG